MATNLKQKRKKLYFDILFSKGTTNAVVPCTQWQTLTAVPGDRYGGLLDALEAVQGGSNQQLKAKNAVSAWFQANSSFSNATSPTETPSFDVMFVGPTSAGINKTIARLPYLTGTAGGGITAVLALSGHEAIYSITAGILRHFAIKVRKHSAALSVGGTLYVQRQHSIEV